MRQEVIDFLEMIQAMRASQRKYFKSRGRDDLIASKRLETDVDTSLPSLIHRLKEKPTKN